MCFMLSAQTQTCPFVPTPCANPELASWNITHKRQLCGLSCRCRPWRGCGVCRMAQMEHFLDMDRPYITQSPVGHCKCFGSMRHVTRAHAGPQTGMKSDLMAQRVRTIFQLHWKQKATGQAVVSLEEIARKGWGLHEACSGSPNKK